MRLTNDVGLVARLSERMIASRQKAGLPYIDPRTDEVVRPRQIMD